MNKNIVSLNEAISFLQFIKSDEEAFAGKQFEFGEQVVESQLEKIKKKQKKPKRNQNLNLDTNEEQRKNINKNRAIKRIIETSRTILENNYRFVQKPVEQKLSYVTQMNIYLKQYNRLSEQIFAQKKQEEEEARRLMEEEEEKLEQVYNYIVCHDFRQVLDVAVVKQKISKSNINIMMDLFRNALVTLTAKQLRVYNGSSEENQFRDIKLFQIQNVDYHTQPYIFTVFTITKDKTQGQEYLYFRFDSIENQNKWDRAIFCNYITKKMKNKSRYFEIDYPNMTDDKREKDRERNAKQREEPEEGEYEINRNQIFKTLANKKETDQSVRGSNSNATNLGESPPNFKMDRMHSDLSRDDKSQNTMVKVPDKSNKRVGQSSTPSMKQHQSSNNSLLGKQLTKKETGKLDQVEELDHSQFETSKVKNQSKHNFSNDGDQKKPPSIQNNFSSNQSEVGPSNIFDGYEAKSEVQSKSQHSIMDSQNIKAETKRKVQLRQKYENGIVLRKQNFFSEKHKIFYLSNTEFDYWDYNPKTLHKDTKKVIKMSEIKQCKIDKKKNSITFDLKDKSLVFLGQDSELRDIVEWMELWSSKEAEKEIK